MPPESIATKNLKKASGIAAKKMLAAVQKARKAFMADVTATLKKPSAWSATGRAALDAKADAIFRRQLVKALDDALNKLSGTAATQGNAEAMRQAGEAIPQFSKEYLAEYLSRVTPANAPSLTAVYTASMAENAKTALRQTAVSVFTVAAATGLTTRERMKLFQAEWAERAKNDDPCRFVDKSGRRWENARYVQMLARTTAQRVQTAAFCDSMLQGGFPLARISNDSGALTCDICAQWQGRLIDLTPGHKLKGGTYTLAEAREAGVFHPNCTHRLEYVPIEEYPKRLLPKVKGKLGEDNAFGKPRPSTHAGLPTKAQTEAHEKAVEEAAQAQLDKNGMPGNLAERIAPLLEDLAANGKRLGGSTGAYLLEVDGRKYVVKPGANEEHLLNEIAADEAYEAAGLQVPKRLLVELKNGKKFKVADFVEGEELGKWWKKASAAERTKMGEAIAKGLDVDAMLGNWDVIGMGADNILIDKQGHPWRIDNGGSLAFRAQGAKKALADWAEGWPNELFTMHESANNKPYVAGATPLTLIRQASARDWAAIIDKLPVQERAAMRKRVAEMRQLAERAEDFTTRGGYTEPFTERILRHSFNLSKEGFREEVPKTIKDGSYGFCRTTTKGSSAGANADYGELALAAVKTVGTHLNDGKYNQATLNAFYAKEQGLKDILKADPNNAGAKHYLDVMSKVKNAVATNTALPMIDTSVKVAQPKASTPTSPYSSLTDHIAHYMKANGGDYGFISNWCVSQASDSWKHDAVKRKVVQMEARGINWKPPPPTPGVWYGDAWRNAKLQTVLKHYEKNPSELAKDVESVAQYKAAVQLLLENADFANNDKTTRSTILFRTEQRNVLGKLKKGDIAKNDIAPSESFSVFRTVIIGGADKGTIAKVPWSRVNAIYFMERTPGDNDDLFMGDRENEANVDAVGLHRIYAGTVKYGEDVSKYFNLLP